MYCNWNKQAKYMYYLMDEITLRKVEAKKEKESSPEYSTLTVVSKSPPSPTSPSRTCLR